MRTPDRPKKISGHRTNGGPPVYLIRAPRRSPSRSRSADQSMRLVGALFGLGFMVFLVLGLVWVVVSGAGENRFIFKPTTGTPTPLAGAASSAPDKPVGTPFAGTITGSIGWPSGDVPAQKICAIPVAEAPASTSDGSTSSSPSTASDMQQYCINHAAVSLASGNSLAYQLTVPVGTYYVYAALTRTSGGVPTSFKAYYDQYVLCGGEPTCSDSLHTQYVPVVVRSDQTLTAIHPTDWYTKK